jgi:mono/diheme cytochrome c family protein
MRPIRISPAGVRFAFGAAACGYALVTVFAVTGYAGQARTVASGVYSAAQATRGKAVYADQCAACHGDMLEGVVGPPLAGADFLADFAGSSAGDLIIKIHGSMPQQAPGTLTDAQSADLTAYILQVGKYPAGTADLTAANAGAVMFPGAKAAPVAVNANGLPFVPVANLAQLMRGITFPNANIIFNTQLKDPGKDAGKPPVPFDYVQWGSVAYHGWQSVDNAAYALQETTPLFLLPGRKCQNGRPVPVQNADYQKYTMDLIAFAQDIYKAAQTRDSEKVSDLSEKLNDVCANCHKVYRDVQPGGALQSSSTAGAIAQDRCNPMPTGVGRAQ